MKMNNRSELLGTYDVKKLLIKLTIPATLGMVVNALYNLVDTLFVGLGAGEIAIGALGFAFPVQMIIMAFGLMIGIGSASVFSRAYGREDHEQMRHVANTAIRIDLFIALLFSILGFFIIVPMLEFFGATDQNIDYAISYLQIILIGLVPLTLSMVLNNLTRAEGRAKIAMIAMMLGAGLNIVLDPIFIFVFSLGVQGAAIATVISQITAFIYIFIQAQSKDSELHIRLNEWFDVDVKTIWEILKIGFPTFIRNAVGALLMIFIFRMIAQYGAQNTTMYQSIYSVINRIMMFLFFPAFGLVQGLAPIAGFNFGAKKPKRLYDVIIFATTLIVVYFIAAFLFIQVLSPFILTAFSKNNDTFFIETGTFIFRIISYGYILVGFQIILGSIYQAFGYPIRAMLIALSRQFILFFPIAFVLTSLYELNGLWYTFALADILAGVISFFMMVYELRIIKQQTTTVPL